MGWKRKVNAVLGDVTGFHLAKVGQESAAAALPVTKTTSQVRPPSDLRVDRLLRAPIFVMSPVRSGSTMLRAVLNAHSLLHAPHEMHIRRLKVEFGTRLSERAMHALGHNQADLEHLLWDRVLHRELVRSGKTHIVDKTPANAFAWERLSTCWPDARYLFLLRHPASIATSWYDASDGKRDQDEAARDALRYMKAVERARQGLPGLTVRYEDLTAAPEKEIRHICDFLSIPFEPAMIEYGDQGPTEKGLGDWKDKIRSGAVQPGRDLPAAKDVPEVLRSMSAEWGYLNA